MEKKTEGLPGITMICKVCDHDIEMEQMQHRVYPCKKCRAYQAYCYLDTPDGEEYVDFEYIETSGYCLVARDTKIYVFRSGVNGPIKEYLRTDITPAIAKDWVTKLKIWSLLS